jgi:hypothetical protein
MRTPKKKTELLLFAGIRSRFGVSYVTNQTNELIGYLKTWAAR